MADDRPVQRPIYSLARLVLTAFLLTFIAARTLVILIITRRIPDLYMHIEGTHVHHLNYGIFLLAAVGAYLLFLEPTGRKRNVAGSAYGVGLALTFDEFGMWLHLGGSYWQRASFDAVVIIAALLGLVAVAPVLRRFRPRHFITTAVLGVAVLVFLILMIDFSRYAGRRILPALQQLEEMGPK